MQIRRARVDEAQELSALAFRSKAVWGYDAEFLAASEPDLRVTEHQLETTPVFVAEIAGEVAGLAALEGQPPEIELVRLFVNPSMLRSGLGRQLVEHVVQYGRRHAYASLMVASDPNSEGFYLRLGFSLVGDSASIVDPQRRLPVLRRSL
jgi:N-acetylglutamate synthase-like GNAT family acetyltransferase